MIQWPIVSALPDGPVSASFISCKKWATFCGGLHGEVERPAAQTSVQDQCEVKRLTEQSRDYSPALLLLISKDNLSNGHELNSGPSKVTVAEDETFSDA